MNKTQIVLEEFQSYWNERSDTYSLSNIEELNNFKKDAWLRLLVENAPKKQNIRVLDIGCGPGLFAILMASIGNKVSAIDISEGMIKHAKQNSDDLDLNIEFKQVEGNELPFEDDEFDLIISRNVVWNIENPIEAFKEWRRVLNKEGKIIYFDANWYSYLFDNEQRKEIEYDRSQMKELYGETQHAKQTKSLENIAKALPLSKENRPSWDLEALKTCGFNFVEVKENVGEYVWDDKQKIQYRATPMFMIVAK